MYRVPAPGPLLALIAIAGCLSEDRAVQQETGTGKADDLTPDRAPRGGSIIWVDATGSVMEGVVHGFVVTPPDPFAAPPWGLLGYFDEEGVVWTLDQLTGELGVFEDQTAGDSKLYASTDCSGPPYTGGVSRYPRLAYRRFLYEGTGVEFRVNADDVDVAGVVICSRSSSPGHCVDQACKTMPQLLLEDRTRVVQKPVLPFTPPFHPELR